MLILKDVLNLQEGRQCALYTLLYHSGVMGIGRCGLKSVRVAVCHYLWDVTMLQLTEMISAARGLLVVCLLGWKLVWLELDFLNWE